MLGLRVTFDEFLEGIDRVLVLNLNIVISLLSDKQSIFVERGESDIPPLRPPSLNFF